jgi:hypothetical protein
MKPFKAPDIAATLKKAFYLLRADAELSLQVRQLALTIFIGLALAYGAHTLFIRPLKATVAKRQTHIEELKGQSLGDQTEVLASHLQNLGQDMKTKEHTLAVLSLQEELLHEQWRKQGNDQRFHQVIFTLATSAPVDMQKDLLKMSLQPSRALDGFTLFPVHLEGRSYFENIFHYLAFLETSPEIGLLDTIELTVQSDDPAAKALVDFKVELGRLEVTNAL